MNYVYGFVVVDKDGCRAPTRRRVYDTKGAAVNGYNQYGKWNNHPEAHGKRYDEQTIYEAKPLGLLIDERV